MYKRDQGQATRVAATCLFLAVGGYMGYSWYYWRPFGLVADGAVGLAMLVAMAAWGYVTVWRKERSAEFLIDLDSELRKVVWPGVQPLFDPKTEAWGSTYVVIACTIVLTAIIAVMDIVLGLGIQGFVISRWLMPPPA